METATCQEEQTTQNVRSLHHLMRVRVRKSVFSRLQDIAKSESGASGEYTSVSDIVRAAILNWIQTHESTERLRDGVTDPNFIP